MLNDGDLTELISQFAKADGQHTSMLLVAMCRGVMFCSLPEDIEEHWRRREEVRRKIEESPEMDPLEEFRLWEEVLHTSERSDSRWHSYWESIAETAGIPANAWHAVQIFPRSPTSISYWRIGAPSPILAAAGRIGHDHSAWECIIAGFELDFVELAYSLFRRAGSTLSKEALLDAGYTPSLDSAANWIGYLFVKFEQRAKIQTDSRRGYRNCYVLEYPLVASLELLKPRERTVTDGPRVTVDRESYIVRIDGHPYPLMGSNDTRRRLADFIQALIDADGDYRAMSDYNVRGRDIKNQPEAISALFESEFSKGTRIPRDKLWRN